MKQQLRECWETYSVLFLIACLLAWAVSGVPWLMAIAIVWAMSRPYA